MLDVIDPHLEAKLKDVLELWVAEGTLDAQRSARLTARLGRPLWQRWALVAGLVLATAVATVVASPAVRVWAAQNLPVVGAFLRRWTPLEKGWAWAEAHGGFKDVLAEARDQGYTFRVHRVLADATKTLVIFTVAAPEPLKAGSRGLPTPWGGPDRLQPLFNGKPFLTWGGGRHEVIDGVLVGSYELNAIPAARGTMTLQVRALGSVTGRWDVTFPVDRQPLDRLTRKVTVGRSVTRSGITITVEDITITPVQTEMNVNVKPESGQFVDLLQPELVSSTGALRPRGSGGRPAQGADDRQMFSRQYHFDRLEGNPDRLSFLVPGALALRDEVLSLPLTLGASAQLPDGRSIRVQKVEVQDGRGLVELKFPHDSRNPTPFARLYVIDDAGTAHEIGYSGGSEMGEATLRLSLELPAGRSAVRAEARGLWVVVPGPWEMEIPLR